MIEERSDAVKRAMLHRNLECQVHESRQIRSGQTGDGKSECRHSRNQRGVERGNLNKSQRYVAEEEERTGKRSKTKETRWALPGGADGWGNHHPQHCPTPSSF